MNNEQFKQFNQILKTMQISAAKDLKFPQPKVGLTQAVVNKIIDLGTQEDSYQGNVTNRHKLLIEFAIPTQTHTFDEETGPVPLKITRFFTASLHPKGALKPFLEGLTGKAVEAATFNTKDLIGVNCFINIISYAKQNGDEGTRIASVSPKMEGTQDYPAPDGIDFSLDNFDAEVYNGLSQGIKDMIAKSPEFKAIMEKTDEPLPF